jgi:coenzyme F420-reducing hydrogenase delta subunit
VKDPKIVVFACSWYPLTAIDNAGEDGCRYAASTTVVPLECGGSLTTAAVLQAFAGRADGVLVAACGEGDCHYANGNESCAEVVDEAREIMALSGLAPERLRFELSSSVDGGAFASLVQAFAADVGKLNGRAGAKQRGKAAERARGRPRSKDRRGRKRAPRAKSKRVTKRAPRTRSKRGTKRAPRAKAKRGTARAPRAKQKRRARGRAAA